MEDDHNKEKARDEKVPKSFKRRKKRSKGKKTGTNKEGDVDAAKSGVQDTATPLQVETDEPSKVTRRSGRSRSSSTKRIKEFFRRSSETRRSRSTSPWKGSVENDNGEFLGATELVDETEFTYYNPALKPRDRLRRMTVKEATRERMTRKSPRRQSSYDREKSSSLPDLPAEIVQGEFSDGTMSLKRRGRKHKNRSKSAEVRSNKYRESEVEKSSANELDTAQSPEVIPNSELSDIPVGSCIRETDLISIYSKQEDEMDESHSYINNSALDSIQKGNVGIRPSIDLDDNLSLSFIDNEKSRRESFSQFLLLSQNMPSFSNSSIARARSRDASPINHHHPSTSTEKDLDISYSYGTHQSEPTSSLKSELDELDENLAKVRSEFKLDQSPFSLSSKRGSKSEVGIEKKNNENTGTENDSKRNKSQLSSRPSLTDKQKFTEERKLSRHEYKSPRRFTGRSLSRERKRKQAHESASTVDKSEPKSQDTSVPVTKTIPKPYEAKQTYRPTFSPKSRYKSRNKKDDKKDKEEKEETKKKEMESFEASEQEIESRDSTSLTESPKQSPKRSPIKQPLTSRSVQTSLQSLLNICDSNNKVKYTPLHPDIEIVDSSKVVEEKSEENKEELPCLVKTAELKPVKQPAIVSEPSDRSGSDVDITPFRTPDASPVPGKKLSSNIESKDLKDKLERKISKSKKKKNEKEEQTIQISKMDDEIEKENFFDASEDIITGKTKSQKQPKLSISVIVALKRKLMRQRKRKAELAGDKTQETADKVKCAKIEGDGSEGAKSDTLELQNITGESDTDKAKKSRQTESETKIIIENETNVNLSKLCSLEETDIVEEIFDSDDTVLPLPKKQISFDPGDEPVTSDECLDDVILRERRSHKRYTRRRESKLRERQKKVVNCCKRFVAFLFSHIGLSTLVVAYSILGGVLFKALEGANEINTRINVTNERQRKVETIFKLATELQLSKRGREDFTKEVNSILKDYQTFIYIATYKNGFNNDDEFSKQEDQWSLASSLLFAITIMTTIGYGHVAPKTDYGRIVTIGYAVFGIPLTLLCLTNIGDLMATGFRLLYAKVCCGVCCILFSPRKRRLPDPEKGLIETDGEVVVQTKKSSSEVIHVPTSVCILLMTSYIMLGTLLFCLWEGWDVVTGAYFSFITLSTIGLGDVVPGTDWNSKEKLVLCALYLVFGLSLIAMCFNLVQEDVKAKFRWLGSKIGLFDRSKT